jgi:myosin heavy subunit
LEHPQKKMIWIPSNTEAWEPVEVVRNEPNNIKVRRKGQAQEFSVPGTLTDYNSVTVEALDENCENLVNLEVYNEGIILHHIKKRFAVDIIYTFVGNILVALNPYKSLDIYGSTVIDKLYTRTKNGEDCPPHIFSIAAVAVCLLRQDRKDQSILISGNFILI